MYTYPLDVNSRYHHQAFANLYVITMQIVTTSRGILQNLRSLDIYAFIIVNVERSTTNARIVMLDRGLLYVLGK